MAHTRKHKRKGYTRKMGMFSRKAKNIFGRAYGKAMKAFYRSPIPPSPIPPPKAPTPLMPLPYLPMAPPPNPVEPRPKRKKRRWPRHVSFAENAKK